MTLDNPSLDAVAPLFRLISRPLRASDEAAAFERFSDSYLRSGVLGDSLHDALVTDLATDRIECAWLLMQVDWKAAEEVEWQACDIAKTLGIDDIPFAWDSHAAEEAHLRDNGPLPTEVGLQAFDRYLTERGHRYVTIDDESDTLMGVALPEEDVGMALELATASGHTLRLGSP